jgi:predicted ATPase
MITEVEIEGFKSFGSPAVCVQLAPLNFVVGPNASGKTNFITAFRFLQNALRQNVEFAVNDLGGASEVRNKRQRQRKAEKLLRIRLRMDFEAKFKPPELTGNVTTKSFDYTLVVDLRTPDASPIVVEEKLRVSLRHGANEGIYELLRDTKQVQIRDPFPFTGPRAEEQKLPIPEQEISRPAVGVGFFSLPAVIFKEVVQGWSFFNVSPQVARQPYKEVPDATLGTYGENLAVVLHSLEKAGKPNGKQAIVAALRSAVPGLKDVRASQDGFEGKWALSVDEDGIRGPIYPPSISDGTIRLIALLVIATLASRKGGLVAIEEPENGVHPHLADHLVSIFREKSQVSQLLVSTHNPAFLDQLSPEEVLLCGKIDGFTKIRRASDLAEIDTFRRHFSLGDLWVQGTFDQLFEGQP